METLSTLLENPAGVIALVTAIVGGVVTICSAIAALTPTPKDDAALAAAYRWIDRFALSIGKAKETGSPASADPPPTPRIVKP